MRSTVLRLTCFLLLAGCEGLPPEPGNPYDPSSDIYAPIPPSIYAYPAGPTIVVVSIHDRSLGEAGFKIERSIGTDSSYVEIGTADANATQYVDHYSFVSHQMYYYRARAFSGNRYGEYSIPSGFRFP